MRQRSRPRRPTRQIAPRRSAVKGAKRPTPCGLTAERRCASLASRSASPESGANRCRGVWSFGGGEEAQQSLAAKKFQTVPAPFYFCQGMGQIKTCAGPNACATYLP